MNVVFANKSTNLTNEWSWGRTDVLCRFTAGVRDELQIFSSNVFSRNADYCWSILTIDLLIPDSEIMTLHNFKRLSSVSLRITINVTRRLTLASFKSFTGKTPVPDSALYPLRFHDYRLVSSIILVPFARLEKNESVQFGRISTFSL